MGYDKTQARESTIFGVGIVTVVILAISLPLLRSYFFSVLEPLQAERAHGAGHAQLDRYHADQARALGGIDNAIATVGQRGRIASPSIAPRRSELPYVDAVEGWAQMKDEAAARAATVAFNRAEAIRLASQQAALAVDGGVPVVAPAPGAPVPGAPQVPAPTPAPAPGAP